jgi:hypothetical protein
MKKTFSKALMTVLAMTMVGGVGLGLTSCGANSDGVVQSSDRNILSITVDETSVPDAIYIGEFNAAGLKLIVTYSDGASETISVTEDMIPEAYKHYIQEVGKWNLTIYYRGVTTTVLLNVQYHYFTVDFYAYKTTNVLEKIATQSILKGQAATAPTDYVVSLPYEHTLYTWSGWDKAFDNVTSDLTVNATYSTETIYWVSFFNGANELIKKQYVKEGGKATAPTAEERAMAGYDFLGWDRAFDNVTKDLSIYGIYFKIEGTTGLVYPFGLNYVGSRYANLLC